MVIDWSGCADLGAMPFKFTNVVVSTSPVRALPADPGRLVMLIAAINSTTSTIYSLGAVSPGGWRFQLVVGEKFELTYTRHGPLVCQELWITTSFPGTEICVATLRSS